MPDTACPLSIIIPAFNEAHRLPQTLERLIGYCEGVWQGFEILVCDDGSTDGTASLVKSKFPGQTCIRYLGQKVNRGKGDAVRRGVLAARGELILVTDADLSTPIREMEKLLPAAQSGAIAMGSRGIDESLITRRQPAYRQRMGKTFNRIIHAVLGITQRDTQCGFKLFRADLGKPFFEKQLVRRFAFDVEMVLRAERSGIPCKEIAVQWEHSAPSRVHIVRDAARMFFDVLVLFVLLGGIRHRSGSMPRALPSLAYGAAREGGVLALYSLITALFTAPAIFHMTRRLFGNGSHGLDWSWSFWWVKKALFDPAISLYQTDLLYWPQGTELYFHLFSLSNCLLYIPLSAFMDAITAYNLLQILTFVLSAYGAYHLAYYVVGNRTASLFAGMAYSFTTYHFVCSFYHLNTSSIQWLPFLFLFFIRMFREGRWYDAPVAAFFFLWNALTCWYLLVYSLLSLPLVWAFFAFSDPKRTFSPQCLRRLALFCLLSAGSLLPVLWPVLTHFTPGGYMVQNDVQLWYSADPLSYILPSQFSTLFGELVRPFYDKTGYIAERSLFLGFSVVFLALLGCRYRGNNLKKLWIIMAAFFFVLSLGPYLWIAGRWYVTWTDWAPLAAASDLLRERFGNVFGFDFHRYALPLPQLLLSKLPFLDVMRVPARYGVVVALSVSVLAAFGLAGLSERLERRGKGRWFSFVTACCCIFFCLEQLHWPYPSQDASIPGAYKRIAADSGDFAIFELPSEDWNLIAHYIHYQTMHQKKIAHGRISRVDENSLHFLNTNPCARILRGLDTIPADVPLPELRRGMADAGFKYVVVNWQWLKEYQRRPAPQPLRTFLDALCGESHEQDGISMYRLW